MFIKSTDVVLLLFQKVWLMKMVCRLLSNFPNKLSATRTAMCNCQAVECWEICWRMKSKLKRRLNESERTHLDIYNVHFWVVSVKPMPKKRAKLALKPFVLP